MTDSRLFRRESSPILRDDWLSELHLGDFQRVVLSSPPAPLYAVSVGRMASSEVGTVQVAGVAGGVPPRTMVFLRAVSRIGVKVLVEGAEAGAVVVAHPVTYQGIQ